MLTTADNFIILFIKRLWYLAGCNKFNYNFLFSNVENNFTLNIICLITLKQATDLYI